MTPKTHKPVVVINGEGFSYCRLCGVPINRRLARNGRQVVTHDTQTTDRYPILDGSLKEVK